MLALRPYVGGMRGKACRKGQINYLPESRGTCVAPGFIASYALGICNAFRRRFRVNLCAGKVHNKLKGDTALSLQSLHPQTILSSLIVLLSGEGESSELLSTHQFISNRNS